MTKRKLLQSALHTTALGTIALLTVVTSAEAFTCNASCNAVYGGSGFFVAPWYRTYLPVVTEEVCRAAAQTACRAATVYRSTDCTAFRVTNANHHRGYGPRIDFVQPCKEAIPTGVVAFDE